MTVVGELTAFTIIDAHQDVLARLAWHLSSLDFLDAGRADKAKPQHSSTYPT